MCVCVSGREWVCVCVLVCSSESASVCVSTSSTFWGIKTLCVYVVWIGFAAELGQLLEIHHGEQDPA